MTHRGPIEAQALLNLARHLMSPFQQIHNQEIFLNQIFLFYISLISLYPSFLLVHVFFAFLLNFFFILVSSLIFVFIFFVMYFDLVMNLSSPSSK